MPTSKDIGNKGEQIAANYLARKGYIILEKNWTLWYGKIEVDIIARDGNELVFVEVKTRTSSNFGKPHLTVSEAQQSRLHTAAEFYQKQKNIFHESRFDVIGVINTGPNVEVTHLPGAF